MPWAMFMPRAGADLIPSAGSSLWVWPRREGTRVAAARPTRAGRLGAGLEGRQGRRQRTPRTKQTVGPPLSPPAGDDRHRIKVSPSIKDRLSRESASDEKRTAALRCGHALRCRDPGRPRGRFHGFAWTAGRLADCLAAFALTMLLMRAAAAENNQPARRAGTQCLCLAVIVTWPAVARV